MSIRKDLIQLSVEINGTKAGATFEELKRNARDLQRELSKLAPGTQAFADKAAELKKVNNVMATIRKETAGVAQGTKNLTGIFEKGVTAYLAYFSIRQVAVWGQQFVGWITIGTIALEAMKKKTEIVFGDSIDIVRDYAKQNAQSLGVTETKYASLAAQIGDILIPMGFQRQEAAKLSADLTNLSGALSEWTNGQRSAEDVSKILAKALTGERESLKELGIVITEADISARLLEKGQNKLTGTMLQQAKAVANYELILERSKDAQTAFVNNQDSIARSGNRVTAALEQAKERILSDLLPAWKALTNAVANLIAPYKQQSEALEDTRAQFNAEIAVLKRGELTKQATTSLVKEMVAKYKDFNITTEDLTSGQDRLEQTLLRVNQAFEDQIRTLNLKEKYKALDSQLIDIQLTEKGLGIEVEKARERLKQFEDQVSNSLTKDLSADDYAAAYNQVKSAVDNATQALRENQKAQADIQKQIDDLLQFGQDKGIDLKADEKAAAAAAEARAKAEAEAAAEAEKKAREAAEEEARKERERILQARLKSIQDTNQKERLLRLQSIEFLRNDETAYNAEKARITLESEIKTARQSAALYKEGTLERLKYLQEALDKEVELSKVKDELLLKQREEQIEKEFELRRAALREELSDEEDRTAALEIAELERQQRLAQARLSSIQEGSSEYQKAINDIADLQAQIDKKNQDNTLRLTAEGLERRKLLAIKALDQLGLDEADYQKARERIELETDIAILQSRISLYAQDADERLRLEQELADKVKQLNGITFSVPDGTATSGGTSTPDDQTAAIEAQKEKLDQYAQAALSTTNTLANAQLSIERDRIDRTLQLELDAIDRVADARRQAAGDDAVLLAKIDAQARAEREKAEKKAAKERKKLARTEAVIQGALAVVEALPNTAAAVAAGIATAAQIAVIDQQSFYRGGPTGSRGIYRDSSGHSVAGVVHTDEYVIPRSITQDPEYTPVISYLEQIRRAKGGYAEGGYTTVSTKPAAYVQTVTGYASMPELADIRGLLQDIKSITAAWPKVIKAVMAYTEFETTRDTYEDIRSRSKA